MSREHKTSQEHWEVLMERGVVVSNTAEELWDAACRYFQWCKDNPIITSKNIASGNNAGGVYSDETVRPFSVKALCLHCGIMEEYFADLRNNNDPTNEWYIVVSRILYIIYTQAYEMSAIGVFNAGLTVKVMNFEPEQAKTRTLNVRIVKDPELKALPLSTSENDVLKLLEKEFAE